MRMIAGAALALGIVGAMAVGSIGTTQPAQAQGVYLSGPGVDVEVGRTRHRHRYRYNRYRYSDDYAYTPRRWHSWNGCPRHYTIQDGVCKPYRGY